MDLRSFLIVLITAICMAAANLLMRAGVLKLGGPLSLTWSRVFSIIFQPLYFLGLLLVAVAGILWTRVISSGPLTLCYPLFVSLTYILICLGAILVFHERLSAVKLVSLALILSGMVLLTLR